MCCVDLPGLLYSYRENATVELSENKSCPSPLTQHRTRRCLVLEPARWIIPVMLGRMEYSRMGGPLDGLIRSPIICSSCWMVKVVSSAAVTA